MNLHFIGQPPPQRWTQVGEALADDPGITMMVGASDNGKTTWISLAAR